MGATAKYLTCLTIGLYSTYGWSEPSPTIVGTWQLVRVVVPSMEGSNPRGIPAVKEHYTKDGRLYFIGPEEALNKDTPFAKYSLTGTTRLTHVGDETYEADISFLSPTFLQVTQKDEDRWCYQRLEGKGAPSRPIEPLSVETVGKTLSCTPSWKVEYDESNYKALPARERVVGLWEVVAHRNVDKNEAPPYGYLNDAWLIASSTVSVLYRHDPQAPPNKRPYSWKNGALVSELPDGTAISIPVSFDTWGHLILDFDGHQIVMKLMTRDVNTNADLPPLTITFLSLKGET